MHLAVWWNSGDLHQRMLLVSQSFKSEVSSFLVLGRGTASCTLSCCRAAPSHGCGFQERLQQRWRIVSQLPKAPSLSGSRNIYKEPSAKPMPWKECRRANGVAGLERNLQKLMELRGSNL